MVETILAAPVILFFAVVMFGFGVGFKRIAPAQNAARYDAWRQATRGAPGPKTDAALAQAFYPKDAPDTLGHGGYQYSFPASLNQPLIDAAAGDAQGLAQNLQDTFPQGVGVGISVKHQSTVDIVNKLGLMGAVTRRHQRLDGDWRYAGGIGYNGSPAAAYADGWHPHLDGRNVFEAESIRQQFLQQVDTGMQGLSGNLLADGIRDFYLSYPGYHGPNHINSFLP